MHDADAAEGARQEPTNLEMLSASEIVNSALEKASVTHTLREYTVYFDTRGVGSGNLLHSEWTAHEFFQRALYRRLFDRS